MGRETWTLRGPRPKGLGAWAKKNRAGQIMTLYPWGPKLVEVLGWPDEQVFVGPRTELQIRLQRKLGMGEWNASGPG